MICTVVYKMWLDIKTEASVIQEHAFPKFCTPRSQLSNTSTHLNTKLRKNNKLNTEKVNRDNPQVV